MNKFLRKFEINELVIISFTAALGLAVKPVVVPLIHMITGPLMIPGGALAGGFYMLWIVVGAALIDRRGTATLIALVQAIIVMISGTFGTHGFISLLTYALPGIMIDIFLIITRKNIKTPIMFFLCGAIANISGTYLSNLVFFRLPIVPLMFSLSSASISGGIGGLIAYLIFFKIKKIGMEI
ncbi:ECF transporter S component [Clostridiaceae bacterium HSG29]|nr:ECF transporter S component [Clostridiaceae bacterium HSG29]